MSRLKPNEIQAASYAAPNDDAFISISFSDFVIVLRRQVPLIIVGALIGLVLATLYVFTTTPLYEASARILLVDSTRPTDPTTAAIQSPAVTDIAVASQIELIKSLKVSTLAVDNLQLQKDSRMVAQSIDAGGLFAEGIWWVRRYARSLTTGQDAGGDIDVSTDEARYASVLNLVFGNLKVIRQPGTYVVDVSFESPYPELAAKVANGAADAYLEEQFTSSLDASVRASEWVSEQVGKLQRQASEASKAAEAFRKDHNLIETDGRLVVDKQLSDAVSQLSTAQSVLSQARSTLEQSVSVLNAANVQSILASMGNDETVASLRDRYTTAVERFAAIAPQLGEEHDQVKRLHAEIEQLSSQLVREYGRIVEGNRGDVAIKQANVDRLTADVATLRDAVASANDNLVRFHELERTAETLNSLYQTFLLRQQEADQRGSYPVSQARVIQKAQTPTSASSPKRIPALILGLLGGVFTAAAIGLFREVFDRSYRNGRQVAEDLEVSFLGYFPSMTGRSRLSPRAYGRDRLRYVVAHPESIAAGTMRNLRVALDRVTGAQGKVIAITSALESEGKTTIAANFAHHAAQGGKRVLLIDLDFVAPTLSRSYRKLKGSVFDAIVGTRPLAEVAMDDPHTPELRVLGILDGEMSQATYEMLATSKFTEFLASARAAFDYVVLDLPPVGPVAETKFMVSQADACLIVVAWGSTSRRSLMSILEPLLGDSGNIIGAVVSKVGLGQLRRYEHADWSPEQYGYLPRRSPLARISR